MRKCVHSPKVCILHASVEDSPEEGLLVCFQGHLLGPALLSPELNFNLTGANHVAELQKKWDWSNQVLCKQ